jgi:predicted pyridoxine 5'-phosphate oxidase superfamily flavin-nucleotide-binding protein
MEFITDPGALEDVYGRREDWDRRGERRPTGGLDDGHRAFIRTATLVVVSTVGHGGVACSPRGTRPGAAAAVIDDQTMWVPDAAGGRMHQTVRNLMDDPRIGLLLLAPPIQRVLRVEGLARVTADPVALTAFGDLDPPVRTVLVVDVQAVRLSGTGPAVRAGLWPQTVPAG